MTTFIPGKPVVSFETKKGDTALIRYPQWEDLPQLTEFINELSAEDTYILFSGEAISEEDEVDFLLDWYKRMEFGDGIYLVCVVREMIVCVCEIRRYESDRRRGEHVATLGLSVRASFRGDGIGKTLAQAALEEAQQHLEGLRMITLRVFADNITAIELYKKLGFVEVGRLPGAFKYKDSYQDRLEMALVMVQ
jgi:RimJ/RimL family protein N-acetyltransferase